MPRKTFDQLRKQQKSYRKNLVDTLKFYFKALEFTRKDYPFFLQFTHPFVLPGDSSCIDAFQGVLAMSPKDIRVVHIIEGGEGSANKLEELDTDSLWTTVMNIGATRFEKKDLYAFAAAYPAFVAYEDEFSKYVVEGGGDEEDDED